MEQRPYVSCIKINGVPILPPLMTEDLRTEMNYYKQLAVAVEERLKALEICKQAETDEFVKSIGEEEPRIVHKDLQKTDSYDSVNEDSSATETETSTVESTRNIDTVIDFPTKGKTERFSSLDTSVGTDTRSPEFFNDYESGQKAEDLFASSTCSDTITASTDLNQYLDVSPVTQRTITPELVKPQVPKTLDIIPITVDVPKGEKNGAKEGDDVPKKDTPPKLVRQGSYILETPSPMLLAHMQTELDNSEYIPTATNAAIKRKEWNISQAKSEWENEIRNKELIIPVDSSRGNFSQGRCRRNSLSAVNNQKTFKSLTNSKNSYSLGSQHRSARSVDCIQTMLDKELVCKSPNGRINNCNEKRNTKDNCILKSNNSQKWRSSRNVSILNLANRLGGSMGNLTNFGGQFAKSTQPEATIIENTSTSPSPSKSVAMSEKLVIIFKEIQRKHEEQMTELIAKQQREQKNMQEEFEKQQVLLLGQIKKTFPGISVPQPSEIIPDIPNDVLSRCFKDLNPNDQIHCSDNNESPHIVAKCPLDYIYPLNGHCEVLSSKNTSLRSNDETSEEEASKGDEFPLDDIKRVERSADKYSNVSRRLFPLDSNTVHVPVPVNVLYTAKQIKAATVINAYARGYLVRRLMKTERVISLKNTYKEALHCMLKLHVDAPLNLPELNFHQRLQLQCDAASMNIAELFAQTPEERMQVISQDREIRRSRTERPTSAHSYSFATQRTLARKKLKEMGEYSSPLISRPCSARSRCQTWTSNSREKRSQNIYHGIKRSTSAGTVRKPWR